jgi:hypothetical protein
MKYNTHKDMRIGQARLNFLLKFRIHSEPNPNGLPTQKTKLKKLSK